MADTGMTEGFDYIIAGGGTAGCVLARRLSDRADCRVLLLEAGPPPNDFWIRTPAGMARMFRSERYNWRFSTEPVPTLRNRRIYWPRGKTLGGSSAINGMVHCRGNQGDFDHWAQLGNQGWGWDDVLPYFKRCESNGRGAGPYHGADGPLSVDDPQILHPTIRDFISAACHTGVPHIDRFSGVEHEGTGVLQCNIRNGARHSAYDAYVVPIRDRTNLAIRTGVHVRRVLFEGSDATGVEVLEQGEISRYHARREVILCGGALSSPQLLMLSGIGDGDQLQAHGIATLVHLPGVGRNLQDHFVSRVQALCTPESSYNSDLTGWRKLWQGLRYVTTRTGYLALSSSQAAAFVKSRPELDYADLEISFRPMTYTYSDDGAVAVDRYDAVGASVYRVRPDSRGEVRLRSADPMQAPAFVPNFLQAPEDVRAMLAGMRAIRAILATEPMASRIVSERVPGPDVRTDEQMIDFMQREGACAFHPAGSCKMGIDAMAVVDCAAARARHRPAARGRCLDHADGDLGQHQRTHSDDRGKGVRHDPGGRGMTRPVLSNLFNPRSVAVFGASPTRGTNRNNLVRAIQKHGFAGAVYPVNPSHREIEGLTAYPSVDALPEIPDLALIITPGETVPGLIAQCGQHGIRAAIVYSAGFEEVESGKELAIRLKQAAAANGVVVLGPNCQGIRSARARAVFSFSGSALAMDVSRTAPIAVISQSGALASAIGNYLQKNCIGSSYIVSVGNETCLDVVDVLGWMVEQDDVRVWRCTWMGSTTPAASWPRPSGRAAAACRSWR